MKAKDPGPMEGYEDWKIENVPVDLARRLKAAIGAKGLSGGAGGWKPRSGQRQLSRRNCRAGRIQRKG